MSTQSNDFAFGLPIITSLYSASHPAFPMLLYLVSPISLVVLNPIAFTLCEYGLTLLDADSKWNQVI
jgi:hypothetical protein